MQYIAHGLDSTLDSTLSTEQFSILAMWARDGSVRLGLENAPKRCSWFCGIRSEYNRKSAHLDAEMRTDMIGQLPIFIAIIGRRLSIIEELSKNVW